MLLNYLTQEKCKQAATDQPCSMCFLVALTSADIYSLCGCGYGQEISDVSG